MTSSTTTVVRPPIQKQQQPPPQAEGLALFFAVAYIAQGFATQWGLIAQPLQFFMMKGLNMSAAQVSSCLALMMLPWVAKPLYGFVCDFVPFFGYRRKSYLIAACLMSASAFAVMATFTTLPVVLATLLISALGMSMGTAVMVGLAVEDGRTSGKARDHFSSQAFWYYVANICAAVIGGWLCQTLMPKAALSTAAICAIIPLVASASLTPLMLKEARSTYDKALVRETWLTLVETFKNRTIWLVALMYFCFNFFMSFGVPLYFFESKTLLFSQTQIGQLSACTASGMLLGTVVYSKLLKAKSITSQLILSIVLMTISTVAYLGLSDMGSGIALELMRGTSTMIMLLAIYAVAAEVCPRRAEVSIMALLVAVRNLATETSTFTGGNLFTHVFHNQYHPLVLTSTLWASLGMILVYMWTKSSKSKSSDATLNS